jgi:hypothetical protein
MKENGKTDIGVNIGEAVAGALGAAPVGGVDTGAAAPRNERRPPGAQKASAILSRFGMSASLSAEARDYLKNLELEATELLSTLGGRPAKITITPVPCEKVPIMKISADNKIHLLMAFTDTYQPPIDAPFTPPSRFMAEAARDLINAGTHIATTLVVTPESYALRPKMVRFIVHAFLSQLNKQDFQISLEALKNDRYIVRTRVADVRKAIEEHYPVATIPPFDVGLAVYTNPTERNGTSHLLFAIGAQTVFVSTSQTGMGYAGVPQAATPITVITVMVEPAPSLSMTIFGLSLAADGFFSRQMWRDQFTDFRKGEPNIGNLIPDADGKPFHVGDAYTLQEFISTKLQHPPLLALDIADGAPRVCGMELICANLVNQDIAQFLGRPIEELHTGISAGVHMQYSGCFGDGTDTRAVTYLRLCAEDPTNVAAYIPLLVRNTNPEFTLRALAELYNNQTIVPLYSCNRTIINAAFLNLLASIVSPQLDLTWETDTSVINNAGRLPAGDVAAFGVAAMYGGGFGAANTGYPQVMYRP